MNFNKVIGYCLLFLGLGIIFWGLYSSYNIFTGQTTAPEIFAVEKAQKETSSPKGTLEDIQKQVGQLIETQFQEMIPEGSVPRFMNLISWSIFIGIIIFGASRISLLGINLIKE